MGDVLWDSQELWEGCRWCFVVALGRSLGNRETGEGLQAGYPIFWQVQPVV